MSKFFASLALTMLAGITFQAPVMAQSFDSPEFDAAVRRYIENNPQVLLDSINAYVAAQREAEAEATDMAFLEMSEEFVNDPELPVIGNPDGDITMVYVLDGACTYCRRMTEVVAGLVDDNPDLRIVQRWVPFLGPASNYAARIAEIVSERFPAQYYDFYSTLMHQTAQLTPDIVDAVVIEVLGEDAYNLVLQDHTALEEGQRVGRVVANNLEIAQRAGVEGTPFFFVEGMGRQGIFRGAVPAEMLQGAIDAARDQ